MLVEQVCFASDMHEPYLIYTKIPAFVSHKYFECERSCLARNAHDGCQIHGMIPARRVLQGTLQIACFTLKVIASYRRVLQGTLQIACFTLKVIASYRQVFLVGMHSLVSVNWYGFMHFTLDPFFLRRCVK